MAQAEWIILEKTSHSGVYSINKTSDTLLAFQKSQSQVGQRLNPKKAKELEDSKRKTLELAGISNWIISKQQLSFERMEWSGTYHNGQKELIYFYEVHLISKNNEQIHYLLTSHDSMSDEVFSSVKTWESEFAK